MKSARIISPLHMGKSCCLTCAFRPRSKAELRKSDRFVVAGCSAPGERRDIRTGCAVLSGGRVVHSNGHQDRAGSRPKRNASLYDYRDGLFAEYPSDEVPGQRVLVYQRRTAIVTPWRTKPADAARIRGAGAAAPGESYLC